MFVDTSRIMELLGTSKNIAVVGDLMVDEYLWGDVKRISPEAPVPIVEINDEQFRPGGSANVAYNLVHLGQKVHAFGVIGTDDNGKKLLDLLKKSNIAIQGIVITDDRPTTIKTRIIGGTQHIARVDKEKTRDIPESVEKILMEKLKSKINELDAIVLEDYNKGVLTERIIKEIIHLARENNVIVTVDPKFDNFFKYKNVHLFKPNKKETEQALQISLQSRENVIEAGQRLLTQLKADSVLITLGSDGMALFQKEKNPLFLPSIAREVADVSGAGDTVIATITALLAAGASYVEAMYVSNIAASIVVGQVGVVPINRDQLIQTVEKWEGQIIAS